ncbi:MAG TPA: ribonuclease Y [Pirellulales bacterium]|nr:ribonuclease Y [Pirellulales bacterium]
MNDPVIIATVSAALAAILTFTAVKGLDYLRGTDAERKARDLVERTQHDIETRRKEAELELKELAIQIRAEGEKELADARKEMHERDRLLDKRQDAQEQQHEQLQKRERMVEATQRKLAEKIEETNRKNEEFTKLLESQRDALHQLSGLSREEASRRLLEQLDQELKEEAGSIILKHERKMRELAEEKSREILITAVQRYASAHTAESTTSTVDIPTDDMKGRIIGREGRNIRAFEKATGVDVIIDDTPGVVIVSGFDPVRREVARLSLQKLIVDGRIHPARIEEVVGQTRVELEAHLQKIGQEAAQEADVGNLNEKIINLLGRLRFRTSYSQNVLRHSIEVAFLSGMLADELGLDGRLARRCGLLHDIGKAADHDQEGGHPKIGAEILKRYGERPEVVHAALGHHDEIHISHPYTVLVAAADACSASRPGARRESLERYIKRMEELETIAGGFPGVEQAFAIQAGRELRVIASARDTTDASAAKICHDIARAFEEQLTYPGEIKVTVLRETRHSEVAR